MADHDGLPPVRPRRHRRAEAVGAFDHGGFGFRPLRPPARRQMGEVVIRKPRGEAIRRAAHIAGEVEPLADIRRDLHIEAALREHRRRRLQGARVRRDDEPPQRACRQLRGGGGGLRVPLLRQAGILDSRVLPRCREVEVELALAVTKQNHGAVDSPSRRLRQTAALCLAVAGAARSAYHEGRGPPA